MQPRRSRAGATLAWGLIAFVALQLGLAVAVEVRLPSLRDPFYAHKAARLQQRVAPGRPFTVVMLGTSRTTYGLQGWRVEQALRRTRPGSVAVFNFGIPAAGPLTCRLTLERLLADGLRPDLVLIEVLPPQLSAAVEEGEAQRLPAARLRWSEVPLVARYGPAEANLRWDWWTSWPLPSFSRRQEILSELCPALLPYERREDWFQAADAHGWVEPPRVPNTPEVRHNALELARLQYADGLAGFRLGGPGCRALEDLVQRCREEQIPAVMVLMPEGSDFRGWYPSAAWGEIMTYLQRLEGEHDAPLIDAREWLPDPVFADSHHLLPPGAALFSELLGRRLAEGNHPGLGMPTSSGSGLRNRRSTALAK